MAVVLAKRMEHLRASEIREILKITERPGMISFAGGLPAPEFFPVDEIRAMSERVLAGEGCRAMQYSTTEGDAGLRRWIAGRMRERHGAAVEAGDVMITSGSQQGLDLTGKILLDEGDVVLCESPTYLGAIQALKAYGPRFIEVPTDDDGMIVEELDRLLSETERVKLVYVIPDFQNPSGRTWSEERRRRFMEVASRHRVPVAEDCPYRDIRFEGDDLPTLKSLDTEGLVIFLGTFSKIFCPGLRLGWLAAAPGLFEKFVMVKQGADLHTSTLSQMLLTAYVETYDIDANIARIRECYRARRGVMLDAMDRELPAGVRYTRPSGGLFLWVELPEEINARELLEACLEKEVAFVPGGAFFPNGGHENTLRLNYSNMPEERIVEGIRRLAGAVRDMMDAAASESAVAARG